MPHWKRSTFSSSPLQGGICSSAKSCTIRCPATWCQSRAARRSMWRWEQWWAKGTFIAWGPGWFQEVRGWKMMGKIPRGPYCWWFYLLYPMNFLGHEPLTSSTFFSSSYKWIYNHDWAWLLGPHIPKLCGFSSPPPSSCTARSGWWQISPKWGFLLASYNGEKGNDYHSNEFFVQFFRQFQLATRGLQFQICRRYATEEFMRSLFPSASELKLSLLYPILKLAAVDRSNEVQRLGSHGWD